jgi:hypothetical protein
MTHEFFDEGLWCALAAAAFSHVHDARAGAGVFQHRWVDQVVHQQHGGALYGFDGLEGEQLGVARAGADQGHGGGEGGGHGVASAD